MSQCELPENVWKPALRKQKLSFNKRVTDQRPSFKLLVDVELSADQTALRMTEKK